MCARVCPTETLCEEACVREAAEGKPVKIGQLQRYATDVAMAQSKQFYARAAPTGKNGRRRRRRARRASPARTGSRCTAMTSRSSTRGPRPAGSTNTASPPTRRVDDFAQAEVDYVTAIGGITIEHGKALGRDFSLADLRADYDAVFLGMGLGGVNALRRRRRGRRRASRTPSISSPSCARRSDLASAARSAAASSSSAAA